MRKQKPLQKVCKGMNKILKQKLANLSATDVNRIVEMAWEDRTPFEAIKAQFQLCESEVIALMRREMKLSSWQMWRARVQGRATKHQQLRTTKIARFHCTQQKSITHNRISKR